MKRYAILFLLAGALVQAAPRTWRFTCDYYSLDIKGHLINRQRYAASYTSGLPGDMVRWNDATFAANNSFVDNFASTQKTAFMEGFSYPHSAGFTEAMKADFFKTFPATAIQQRNFIWDTHMFEGFVHHFADLKLNVPFHVSSDNQSDLAGMGTFKDHDLQLILTGTSKRNGKDCFVIDYRAMFNTLDTKMPGVEMVGRSDYWGQIWIAPDTHEIEYATLFEEVTGELTLQGQPKPMNVMVVRVGTFE